MNIYYEPVNTLKWNIFNEVTAPGQIEDFRATSDMELNDLVIFCVGHKDVRYKSGIYAVGRIVSENYIGTKEYNYGRLSVDIEIVFIDYEKPIIKFENCEEYIKPFQSAHKIKQEYYDEIYSIIKKYINN